MLRYCLLASAGLLVLLACTPDETPRAGPPPPQGVEFPPEMAEPALLTYHPDLHVDITEMRVRPSGLWLQDLVPSEGDTATRGSMVLVRYTGWLHDGTLFESNADTDPFEFRLGAGEMLEGWDEGIVGMRRGGKRKLILPYQLAYGEAGEGEVPPFATLVYDIELIDFRP